MKTSLITNRFNLTILTLLLLVSLLIAPLAGLMPGAISQLLQDLPGALRSLQAEPASLDLPAGQPEYAFNRQAGVFLAQNPQQGFNIQIHPTGVTVRAMDAAWVWQLSLSRWGTEGAWLTPEGTPEANAGNLQGQFYTRQHAETLREWYRNLPAGLEHGFTIDEPPAGRVTPGLPLIIEMEYQGSYRAGVLPGEQGLGFFDDQGRIRLSYDHLKVFDAAGRQLPAGFSVRETDIADTAALEIWINDLGAGYPLLVDPFLTVFSAEMLASDGATDDQFGRSVAVSGDIAVVGAPGDSPSDPSADPNIYNDAAYIFYRNQGSPDGWGEVVKLTPAPGTNADQTFGHAVAVAGDIVAVGAPTFADDGQSNRGTVYVYARNQGGSDNWGLVTQLLAPAGANGDKFGWDLSLDSQHLVVGAPNFDDPAAVNAGAIYVFKRNQGGADNWGFVTRLSQPAPQVNDRLGYAVDVHGDQIVAGAPYRTGTGGVINQGATYIFTVDPAAPDGWSQGQEVLAGDPAANDYFGWDVAVFHDHLVAGAPLKNSQRGAAYLFERNQGGVGTWGQLKKLLPLDSTNAAQFGVSVDLDHDSVVVGAYTWQESIAAPGRGAAFLFERNQTGPDAWGQVVQLVESSGAANIFFGRSVAIYESALIIGANGYDVGVETDQGAAFAYYRTGSSWQLLAQPAADNPTAGDAFGCSLATTTEYLAIGACNQNADQGKVYLYYRNQGGLDHWGLLTTITASDGAAGDLFGSDLAIEEDKILVGAPGADSSRGAVYVYYRNLDGADAWGEQQILQDAAGAAGDLFGSAVDLFLDQAAVGAPGANSGQGEVHIFSRVVDTGDQEERWDSVQVKSVGGSLGLGSSVAINSSQLLAGAPATNANQGGAYMFYRNEGGVDFWGLKKTFSISSPLAGDQFGAAVDLHASRAAIGAPGRSSGQGAVYLFALNQGGTDNWGQFGMKSPGQAGDRLGEQVSLGGDLLAVSAPVGNKVYTFKRNLTGADAWGSFQQLNGPVAGQGYGGGLSMVEDILAVGAPDTSSATGSAYIYLLTEFFQDLAIEKTASASRVGPGDQIQFTINFENQGEGIASDVVITDTLPAGLTDWNFNTSGAALTPGATEGVWTAVSLAPGEMGSITITGTVRSDASSGLYTNLVEISAVEAEIYYNNNLSSVSFEIDTTAPALPVRTSPLDGTVFTATNDITMEWRASTSPDVAGYLLEFNGNVINTTGQRVTVNNLIDGVYAWRVAAYDDLGNISAYTTLWNFTVETGLIENLPPVALAGPDQTVLPGGLVTVDGSGSFDPDGQTPLSYQWTQIAGPAVSFPADQPGFSFTAPDYAGTITFELVVRDVLGLASAPDRVSVRVSASGLFEIYLPMILKSE